jgi:hypothetical protein
MKDRNKNRIEELKQTPVSDGDTRPDQQPEGKVAQPFPLMKDIKNKVSDERNADINSLEDYKDAKAQGDAEVSDTGNTSPVPGGAKPVDE